MKKLLYMETPLGSLGIAEENSCISDVFFAVWEKIPTEGAHAIIEETLLLTKAKNQLEEYFSGKRHDFDLPLAPAGTEFMQKDWQKLREIPYGETRSYKDIATAMGNPKACRAVGLANNRNPIAIIIPCHRVIGSNGSLVGYAGGLHLKKFLLELEGVKC